MKNLVRFIILIIIIVIILIISILIINRNGEEELFKKTDSIVAELAPVKENKTDVEDDTTYYSVSNCVKTYYRYLGLDIEKKNKITSDLLWILNINKQE